MVFRDTTTTSDSSTHYVDFLLGLPDGETSQFSLAARARSTNTAKYELAKLIWRNQDSWTFDDSQNSGRPEASQNLTNSTEEYTLPTASLIIRRVEVADAGGNYQIVTPIDEANIPIALTEFEETDGIPRYYRLEKRSIILYPAPATASVTLTNGLRIYFEREINEFTSTTTTTEIGLGEPGDRIICFMVAQEFAAVRGMQVAAYLASRLQAMTTDYISHISNRSRDMKPRIRIKKEIYE